MVKRVLMAGVLMTGLGGASNASAQVCELPGSGVPQPVFDGSRGPGFGRPGVGRPGGRPGGFRPGPGGFEVVQREVIIPAEYRIVQREVWVEPVYEYRTREVWVPARRPGRGLHLDLGNVTVGLNFGKDRGHRRGPGFGHGHRRGHYRTVTEKVLIRPGYYKIVEERVLVRPERVEIVTERVPIRGGFGKKVGVRY